MQKYLIILLLVSYTSVFAQDNKIDSLENLLSTTEGKTVIEDTTRVDILTLLSRKYLGRNPDTALKKGMYALTLAKQLNYKKGIAQSLNAIGNVHRIKGDYQEALDFFLQALKIEEESNNKLRIAKIQNNIGTVYFYQKDYTKTIDYFHKSLEALEQLGDKRSMAASLNNIGGVYNIQEDHKKALEYFFRAYDIAEEINDKKGISVYLTSIGGVYIKFEEYDKALEYLLISLKIKEELNARKSITYNYFAIGELYLRKQQYEYAIEYYNKALEISRELNIKEGIKEAYESLSELYANKDDYKKAYEYYQLYSKMTDSLFNEENAKQIAEMQTKYESEKKQKQIEIQNLKLNKQDLELNRNRILQYGLTGGVLMLILLSYFVYSRYRLKQKANKQLAEKNKEITDSILYAKYIQEALLPLMEEIMDKLPNSFILFKPKDIVSGDFYWFANVSRDDARSYIIAAVDCTGHGVPGAFMSMLGNAYLSEIVNEKGITKPSDILEALRDDIIKSLKQKAGIGESKDGMDIALCNLEFLAGQAGIKLQYAGANNPLFIVRNGELMETMADRQPIGIYVESKPFTNHTIDLQKGDAIYIFSDGYFDQFGGPQAKKFMIKRFKQLLLSIQDKNMQQQKEHLDKTIEDWKGNEGQVDDILVIGIKV